MGSARPAALGDARLVLRLRADGRLGRGSPRVRPDLAPLGLGLRRGFSPWSPGWPPSRPRPDGLRGFSSPRPGRTRRSRRWTGANSAMRLRCDPRPAFVLAAKWSDAGKIALALGPETPVFVISDDPRGWAFVAGSERPCRARWRSRGSGVRCRRRRGGSRADRPFARRAAGFRPDQERRAGDRAVARSRSRLDAQASAPLSERAGLAAARDDQVDPDLKPASSPPPATSAPRLSAPCGDRSLAAPAPFDLDGVADPVRRGLAAR